MNIFWSHALPIPVFLSSTPSLNLRFFCHENHVSGSFYRFMLRDKCHCLQVWEFEPGIATWRQSDIIIKEQLSQLLHRHTAQTKKVKKKTYRWHLFDWTCSLHIVRPCLTFLTIGVKNPKYDRVQLLCCRNNGWKQWGNIWMLGKENYFKKIDPQWFGQNFARISSLL